MSSTHLKCTDCAHATNGNGPNTTLARWFKIQHGWQCQRAVIPGKFSAVTGRTTPDEYEYCSIERSEHGACGPSAQYWLPLKKTDLFKLLSRKEA